MPRNPATIDTTLYALFPGDAVVAVLSGEASADDLLPAEALAVAKAVALRRQHFAAGRLCARRALEELNGAEPAALTVGEERVPDWPAGITGSIAHTDGLAAAVVGRRTDFQGLGIDVEPRGSVKPHLWEAVCREEEVAWLRDFDEPVGRDAATLLFCAKEAFYKAQFAAVAEWVGFKDVRVVFADAVATRGNFIIEPRRDLRITQQVTMPIVGSYQLYGNFALTGLALRA